MRQKILNELFNAEGRYISGNELAKRFGISRVAVWKHMEALKAEGFQIEGLKNKGYCLHHTEEMVCVEEVLRELGSSEIGSHIESFPTLTSTNQKAHEMLRAGSVLPGSVILSRTQTGGKGRRGREWESPSGGLWFSVVLRPDLPVQDIALLSLVFALAVAEGLDPYVEGIEIKWPNDVFLKGHKIAGILLELSGEVEQTEHLIVGVGVNVNVRMEDFPAEVSNVAGSLRNFTGQTLNLTEVFCSLLQSMDKHYTRYLKDGFVSFRDKYKKRCFHLGQVISVKKQTKDIRGKNIDVDEQGNLLIEMDDRIEKINTGDVSIL
ncbi:MAG: biotin--[acetyl-CoA-carboxylase] ligase [Bacillota bacterium]|nr:biotin--[acetyl-CoA-carboxylase] ligase [Bacillota bacterium]